MDNETKWSIQDVFKEHLKYMVNKGVVRENIIINVNLENKMENEIIKYFVDSDYIERVSEGVYVITEGYYDWLLEKFKKEKPINNLTTFDISIKLKERFCKDMGIPIKVYLEPYFENRLKLYSSYYDSVSKYESFLSLLSNFKSEQDYFEYYNKLKDNIINYLSSRDGMKNFEKEDMNKFQVKNKNYPQRDIFKETNDNRIFISVDMKKANFTSLKTYDSSIVGDKETYEEFIQMFTNYEYFKESKYIRQVVFGNQNPKRQVTYQKYLMDKVLDDMLSFVTSESISSFSNDEIVIDITEIEESQRNDLIDKIVPNIIDKYNCMGIGLKQESFILRKLPGCNGYIKKFTNDSDFEFKCIDALNMPFVLRAYSREKVTEEDKVFLHDGRLAKLIEIPRIEVV